MSVAEEPLPPAKWRPLEAPHHDHEQHDFKEPENTAGQAQRRHRRDIQSVSTLPDQLVVEQHTGTQAVSTLPDKLVVEQHTGTQAVSTLPYQPVVEYVCSSDDLAQGVFLPDSNTPRTTQWRRRKKQLEATSNTNPTPKRAYERKKAYNVCKKCGEPRTATTGHSQYKGRLFCPKTESLSKDEWLENMRKMDKK